MQITLFAEWSNYVLCKFNIMQIISIICVRVYICTYNKYDERIAIFSKLYQTIQHILTKFTAFHFWDISMHYALCILFSVDKAGEYSATHYIEA